MKAAIIRWLLRSYLSQRRLVIMVNGLRYLDTNFAAELWLQDMKGKTETVIDLYGLDNDKLVKRDTAKQILNKLYGKLGK